MPSVASGSTTAVGAGVVSTYVLETGASVGAGVGVAGSVGTGATVEISGPSSTVAASGVPFTGNQPCPHARMPSAMPMSSATKKTTQHRLRYLARIFRSTFRIVAARALLSTRPPPLIAYMRILL